MNKHAAIYVHVPWCRRRCPYCDFYLVVAKPDGRFVNSIKEEFFYRRAEWQENEAQTLYFGGGTPSLLAPESIAELIDFFRREAHLAPSAEITLELNPEDINASYAKRLKESGVNRLSLGVQSFDDEILRFLGRMHDEALAKKSIEELLKQGFNNISIDLIIGVTNEKEKILNDSIEYISKNNLVHISNYLLTIEEGSFFYRKIKKNLMKAPDDDYQAQAYRDMQARLKEHGFRQYEISSFARPAWESQHNQVYWAHKAYLGLGPGAHSMRLLPDAGIERSHNQAELKTWIINPKNDLAFDRSILPAEEAMKEALAFGLRNMIHGISPYKLAKKYSCELPASFFTVVKKHQSYGYLKESEGSFFITEEGALFADAIMRDILSL
jgi:oxygen-independent coproporphyrinogen-3 oxidase